MERYFFSRFDNKVDKKGRVSVPARWRAIIAQQAFQGIVAYPSPVTASVEACGMDRHERLAESIDGFNPFSDSHGAFAAALLTRSHTLAFDGEGRVVLPEGLIEYAGIEGIATFAGRGATFQIWQPEAYETYESEALERARAEAPALALMQSERRRGDES